MKQIIIDTNFLLIPAQFGVDIFSEIERVCRFPHELAVMEGTILELEHLRDAGSAKEKREAKLALGLLKSYKPKSVSMEGMDVDFAILRLAKSGVIVATQDGELKRKLSEKGIALLVLRKEKHLQLIE